MARLSPFLFVIVGVALVAIGLWWIFQPAALIFLGAALCLAAFDWSSE